MKDFTSGNEGRLIVRFAFPLIVGNLLQQFYNIIDSIIVGKYLGTEALAAVGASFPIFYTLISFVIGIGSGATVVISQYFGAKDYEQVKKAIGTIYLVLLVAGLFLTIFGIVFCRQIFELLNIGEDVMPQATTYFSIYMVGMVSFFGFNGTASILRGLGDSRTPLNFLVLATCLNIVLDLLFILVFNWGVAGAAWATVISQTIALVGTATHINRNSHLIRFSLRLFKFDTLTFRQSVRIGLPTGFQQTFVAMGMMALIRIINNFDTTTLAAYVAANRIDAIATIPSMNIGSALSAFVGQNLGANEFERIRRGVRAAQRLSWIFSLTVMAIIIILGEPMMKMFSDDPAVIRQGYDYLIIVSSFYIVFSSMFVMHGMLRGAGDTLIPMFITLISLWIVRIPIAWFLSERIGESGIWWSIPCGWFIGLAGTWLYYKSGKWKGKGVVSHPVVHHEAEKN